MSKEELSLQEREILQNRLGDTQFLAALDHLLYLERTNWERRAMQWSKATASTIDPIHRLMKINEAAAKASIYEMFLATVNARTQGTSEPQAPIGG